MSRLRRLARGARRPRALVGAAILLLLLGLALELFARFYLGLGDPPLSVTHPTIEYLFKPDSTYHRFGNRISYNAFSQRSGPVTRNKIDPREIRVLCLGDSVLNGGALSDDARLATSMLEPRLTAATGRPVRMLNASAGSWGPPNELAYVNEFGWFDADALVVVVSSHDAADVPTFEPIVGVDSSFPDKSPWLASTELVSRYVRPRVTAWFVTPPPAAPPKAADTSAALESFATLIAQGRARGLPVIVLHNPETGELRSSPDADGRRLIDAGERLRAIAESGGATFVSLAPAYRAAAALGRSPYRDVVHPNDDGQRIIAETLFAALDAVLARPTTRQAVGG